MAVNLIPWARNNLLLVSQAPLTSRFQSNSFSLSTPDLLQEAYNLDNLMLSYRDQENEVATQAVMLRGIVNAKEAEDYLNGARGRG